MPLLPCHRPPRRSARIPRREARCRASRQGRRRHRRPARVLSWAPSFRVIDSAWTQATPIFLLRDTRSGIAFPIGGQIKPNKPVPRRRFEGMTVGVIPGTSGWQYRDWRGVFYPPGVPQRRWLEYYAEQFATVENDGTFYRLPARETFAGTSMSTSTTTRAAPRPATRPRSPRPSRGSAATSRGPGRMLGPGDEGDGNHRS